MYLRCPACPYIGTPPVAFQRHVHGQHLGAYCPWCGKWIKWLPKDREALHLAADQFLDGVSPKPAPGVVAAGPAAPAGRQLELFD